jgi:glyoxylase-like metal-dependent hydrolase (beta-lactamase superfamily II)
MYGELLPVDEDRIIIADDGFQMDFHGRILEFMDTPGHARHHYCVVDSESNGVFTGDTMGLSYPELNTSTLFALPTTTPVQFDPDALHDSINRIVHKKPDRLYLTHFGLVSHIKELAEQLHHDIDVYVDIMEACENAGDIAGISSRLSDHLVSRLSTLNPDISPSLAETVLAHDIELNAQGLSFWKQQENR